MPHGLHRRSLRSAILGPPLMTQVFGFFSRASAPVYFPGAAYLGAATICFGALSVDLVQHLRRTDKGAAERAAA